MTSRLFTYRGKIAAQCINYCNIAVRTPKMTISQFEAEQNPENLVQDSPPFEESSMKTSSTSYSNGTAQSNGSKRNPPARNTSRFWFERFLAVIQRQNPSVIDVSFLSQIAPSNEGKLLAQLKFLGVIDEQGKPTRILPRLNMVGEEQKKAFQEIAADAYKDLQSEVKMVRAVPDDLVNFFIRKYNFTRDKAINASKFFLYLVEKSGTQVSDELGAFLTEKNLTAAQSSNLSLLSTSRGQDKSVAKIQPRESKVSGVTALRQSRVSRKVPPSDDNENRSPIQTIINIKLEKVTPREYWDRVLALLGEKSRIESSPDSENSREAVSAEDLGQDVSEDSAFT